MTVIQPNSIAGINSITVQTGQALNVHDASGNLIRSLASSSGVSTYQALHVGAGTTTSTQGISVGTGCSIVSDAVNTLDVYTNNTKQVVIGADGAITGGANASVNITGGVNITGVSTAAAFAPSIGWLGNRNLITNGAMQVNQRGNQTSVSSATYTLDRWKLVVTSCGAYSVSQLAGSDELINVGLRNSLKVDCTTADASPASGDLVMLQQPMEGLVTNPLCWGQSSGKKAVLSFWAKADINGWSSGTKDFVVEIQASDSQEWSTVCQLATAGTWQKFELSIDAKTSSAIAYNNTESMGINWWLDAGSNYKGGSAVSGWSAKANSGGVRAAQQTLAIAAHTDNNFYLTGVQLELGEEATPFEHRSYGEDLARCQRYYYEIEANSTSYLPTTNSDGRSRINRAFPTTMRAAPSGSMSNYTLSTKADGVTGYQSSSQVDVLYKGTFDAEI